MYVCRTRASRKLGFHFFPPAPPSSVSNSRQKFKYDLIFFGRIVPGSPNTLHLHFQCGAVRVYFATGKMNSEWVIDFSKGFARLYCSWGRSSEGWRRKWTVFRGKGNVLSQIYSIMRLFRRYWWEGRVGLKMMVSDEIMVFSSQMIHGEKYP